MVQKIWVLLIISDLTDKIFVGFDQVNARYFNGSIDDVRIYNKALNANQIALLYSINTVSFVNYYSFEDALINNIMLVHAENSNKDENISSILCTKFFSDNELVFQSNNTVSINVWTSLAKPIFTNGVWNKNNSTTTLVLTVSSWVIKLVPI